MPRIDTIGTNFTGGELTPRARGRIDVSKYGNCLDICENYTVRVQGGIYRRSGTRFVKSTKDSTKFARLFEFKFSLNQNYIIEVGNLYFRYYRNQGQLVNPAPTPVETTTPYLSADLPALQYAQSADILYIVHNSYKTQMLSRNSDTSWTLGNVPFSDGPYLDANKNAGITLTPSATAGNITISSNAALFVSTDVGRLVRIQHGTTWGWATITLFTSATSVNATVGSVFGATTAVSSWRLGAFSATTGYPGVVTFHEQRLSFANTTNQPQTVFMSCSADFYNFAPTDSTGVVADSNSIVYTINSSQVNAITWMMSGPTLLIGTIGGEWQVKAPSTTSPLSPTNIQITPQTNYGSAPSIRVNRVGYSTLFLQRSGRKAREMVYEFQIDNFVANDISVFGEHVLRIGGGITDAAYQGEPDSVVWFTRKDGQLAGMTFLKEQSVIGFHRQILGGTFDDGSEDGTNAIVESVAVIPTPDLSQDQVWMIVKRTVNGSQVRYVEFMEESFDPDNETDLTNAFFVDAGITYTGTAVSAMGGLNHLIGQTVAVIADGSRRVPQVVDGSGNITITGAPASIISAGLPFSSTAKLLPFEGGGAHGTAQGKVKRVNKVTVRLNNTLGMEQSSDGVTWSPILFRDTSNPMGAAPPMVTGDKPFFPDMGYNTNGVVWFRQEDPYPAEVLAVMLEAEVYDS